MMKDTEVKILLTDFGFDGPDNCFGRIMGEPQLRLDPEEFVVPVFVYKTQRYYTLSLSDICPRFRVEDRAICREVEKEKEE